MKFRVCWRSKATGYTGQGKPLDERLARAWVEAMDVAHPYIEHWLEPVA